MFKLNNQNIAMGNYQKVNFPLLIFVDKAKARIALPSGRDRERFITNIKS
jgi:hypothetical protein